MDSIFWMFMGFVFIGFIYIFGKGLNNSVEVVYGGNPKEKAWMMLMHKIIAILFGISAVGCFILAAYSL